MNVPAYICRRRLARQKARRQAAGRQSASQIKTRPLHAGTKCFGVYWTRDDGTLGTL